MMTFLILLISSMIGAAKAETCTASWYGSGGGMTAAHKSLPFGTRVRVRNRNNGRTVTVTINDRGPFVKGRCIDLSPAAREALGIDGLAPVDVNR